MQINRDRKLSVQLLLIIIEVFFVLIVVKLLFYLIPLIGSQQSRKLSLNELLLTIKEKCRVFFIFYLWPSYSLNYVLAI